MNNCAPGLLESTHVFGLVQYVLVGVSMLHSPLRSADVDNELYCENVFKDSLRMLSSQYGSLLASIDRVENAKYGKAANPCWTR